MKIRFLVILIAAVLMPLKLSAYEVCPLDETARLIAENWCDNYIDSIVFTDCAVIDGTIMLPLRLLVERTDGDISFDAGSIVVTGEQTIELQINSNEAFVGGNREYIGTAPVIINGRTMVCAFTAAEYLNFEADWNPETEQLTLTRNFQTRRLIVKTFSHMDFPSAERVIDWFDDMTILQFGTVLETREAYENLSRNSNVEWAEPDLVYFPPVFEGRNILYRSWGVSAAGLDRYAQYLIAQGRTEQQVVIAVLDSGLDITHPFFNNRIAAGGRNFILTDRPDANDVRDGYGHGTFVSGIIADSTQGLNNIKILPVRVLGNNGGGTTASIGNGILHARDNNADIINMSVGTTTQTTPFQNTIARVVNEFGITVIAAAGNSAQNAANVTPANTANVFTVAASGSDNRPASWFSNFGSLVDISAPGVEINSTLIGGGFGSDNGTSASAPFVSAAAAMYILKNPSYTPLQIKTSLRTYVTVPQDWNTVPSDSNTQRYYGTGILNMDLAPRTMYTVSFELNGGTHTGGGGLEQTIPHGGTAIAPEVTRSGYFQGGWDIAYDNVTDNITVTMRWLRTGAITTDGEGHVTTMDITFLARHLAGHTGFEITDNRTANLWGEDRPPNLNDVTMMLRWLLGYDLEYLLEEAENE
jgi:subtilisin family serine protease